ncbi:hypothetical protein HanHA89_Chr16g0641591 [Helianthus annuus]|nr:hypothetical protein HanHA89_Chr16g0641591 [Helianthus annuus]
MDTQSPHISPGLTTNPKHNQMLLSIILQQLTLIDGPNPKLPFNRGNQRWSLKHRTGQRLDDFGVECAAVARFLDPEDAFNPGNNLV